MGERIGVPKVEKTAISMFLGMMLLDIFRNTTFGKTWILKAAKTSKISQEGLEFRKTRIEPISKVPRQGMLTRGCKTLLRGKENDMPRQEQLLYLGNNMLWLS